MAKKSKLSFVSITQNGNSIVSEKFETGSKDIQELNEWLMEKKSPLRETNRSVTLTMESDLLFRSLYSSGALPLDDILSVVSWSINEFKNVDIELDSQEFTALSNSIKLREWIKKIKKTSETT